MKKLNITKEQFEKSKYFKNKYGKLEYVSESGKVFKTDKGKLLKFKESSDVQGAGFDSHGRKFKIMSDDWGYVSKQQLENLYDDEIVWCPKVGDKVTYAYGPEFRLFVVTKVYDDDDGMKVADVVNFFDGSTLHGQRVDFGPDNEDDGELDCDICPVTKEEAIQHM